MARLLILLFPWLLVTAALAETTVYRAQAPDGTVEFSDAPAPGARPVTLPELPNFRLPHPSQSPRTAAANSNSSLSAIYTRLVVTSPARDETVFRGAGDVIVVVGVEPALQPEHRIVVSIDGVPQASGHATRFALAEVDRGTHTLVAAVQDQAGKVLLNSAPVIFHVRQHSRLFRAP